VAGDTVIVTESASFRPVFGILQESTNQYIGQASITGFTARQAVTFPVTGWYAIVASSQNEQTAGPFTLDVSCSGSGCLQPIISRQPAALTKLPQGGRVTLSFAANGTAPMAYAWQDEHGISYGSSPSFLTPPVQQPLAFYGTAINACGSAQTDSAIVSVVAAKRRVAGR
jgi:hypothetical protein